MSAETPSWNTGACHASLRRRAIVFRVGVSWTISTSVGVAGRRRGRRSPGPLHVFGHDPPVGARAGQAGEVDPAFPRHAARER